MVLAAERGGEDERGRAVFHSHAGIASPVHTSCAERHL